MILEEQRHVHEDLERLEEGIAARVADEPRQLRDRLNRDHEVSQLLDQIQKQSASLLALYKDISGTRTLEVQQLGGSGSSGGGDPFDEFYRQVGEIREHHARYPNEQAENSETRYRPGGGGRRRLGDDAAGMPYLVDSMFSGEEAFGRFFDLHTCHEAYVNLPNVKRITYLDYLGSFDDFSPGHGGLKRGDKSTDQYFKYVGRLAAVLESFMQRTRPLENLDKVFATFDAEFDAAWNKDEIPGWQREVSGRQAANGDSATHGGGKAALSSPDAVWCDDCEKEFKNENVYKGHLSGRKHINAAEQRAQRIKDEPAAAGGTNGAGGTSTLRLKERAVAEREYRIKRLASAMSTEREDTRVNVERRQGMTERERQQELDNFFNMTNEPARPRGLGAVEDDEDDEDGEEKIYNPLKLPLAWDGKPIPFWLYRLHGLGVEFSCEICGNFVYMGRRAFDKHFNDARHIYGLKCLGVNNTALFRDITSIEEALRLWDKVQRERQKTKVDDGSVVQMEDAEGNVMPEKVYYDLQKQGLL